MNSRLNREDRKVLQLCAQVKRTMSFALGECEDELVSELYVDRVEPYPNASRLMVFVHHSDAPRTEVLSRLDAQRGELRAAVAASIHRKKTPVLVFELAVVEGGVSWD